MGCQSSGLICLREQHCNNGFNAPKFYFCTGHGSLESSASAFSPQKIQ